MRHALRRLLATPGFTAIALVTLALGIGLNTSMFCGLHAALFSTPYRDDAQLVRIYRTSPHSQSWPHSPANFLDHHARNTVFTHLAAVAWNNYNLSLPGEPAERLRGLDVSGDFFAVFGLPPALGRWLGPDDDRPGAPAVIVLSHTAWRERFGADPSVVGRSLRIDGAPATVVGVAPARFDHSLLWGSVDAWRPLALSDAARQNRYSNYLHEFARLQPGVSLPQAQAALATLAANLAAAHPEDNANESLRVVPLVGAGLGEFHVQLAWLLAGLAAFVLLIACANLANLQFARHAARDRDRAVRAALGASRGRLMRKILAESLLLSLAGGALGLVVALWSNDLLTHHFALAGPVIDISLSLAALAFAFVASLLTGLAFGALPAWFSSRANVAKSLRQSSPQATAGRAQQRMAHALIVAEVALALVLLAGTGFFQRGLHRFLARDPAWRADEILSGQLELRGSGFATSAQRRAFAENLRERLAALPGVTHAALGSALPTWGFSNKTYFVAEGLAEPARGAAPLSATAAVTPDYFRALDLPLVEGRAFTDLDRADTPDVVIVNESLARALWPGGSALGRRLGDPSPFLGHPREIVGVVRDAIAAGSLGPLAPGFQMYRPFAQEPPTTLALALRTAHPEALVADVRRTVATLAPDLSVHDLRPVRAAIAHQLGPIQLAADMLGAFALLGLALAAVGIFGVISHAVARRTAEIGVRLALGAQVRDILRLVLGHGLRLAGLGIALGLVGTVALARLLHAVMPGLPPADLPTAAATTALLFVVALVATWLPARRATRVDPLVALRAE